MTPPEDPRQLCEDALQLQLELECGCYCGSLSAPKRPCSNHRSAAMIGRLIAAMQRVVPEETR